MPRQTVLTRPVDRKRLAALLKREARLRLRERLQAVWWLSEGGPAVEVAAKLGRCRQTVAAFVERQRPRPAGPAVGRSRTGSPRYVAVSPPADAGALAPAGASGVWVWGQPLEWQVARASRGQAVEASALRGSRSVDISTSSGRGSSGRSIGSPRSRPGADGKKRQLRQLLNLAHRCPHRLAVLFEDEVTVQLTPRSADNGDSPTSSPWPGTGRRRTRRFMGLGPSTRSRAGSIAAWRRGSRRRTASASSNSCCEPTRGSWASSCSMGRPGIAVPASVRSWRRSHGWASSSCRPTIRTCIRSNRSGSGCGARSRTTTTSSTSSRCWRRCRASFAAGTVISPGYGSSGGANTYVNVHMWSHLGDGSWVRGKTKEASGCKPEAAEELMRASSIVSGTRSTEARQLACRAWTSYLGAVLTWLVPPEEVCAVAAPSFKHQS